MIILVTTDLSVDSQRTHRPAEDLARDLGATIELMHVAQDVPIYPHGAPLAPLQHDPDMFEYVHAAEVRLEAEAAMFEVPVSIKLMRGRDIANTIVTRADELDARLIVMSTHGRSALGQLVLGSIAGKVLRRSHVPVVAIPPGVRVPAEAL